MNDDYFAQHGYTEKQREEYEAAKAVAKDYVNAHLDDPLIERLRLSNLLLAQAVRGISQIVAKQDSRIKFLEQMLLKEES